MKIEQIYTGCIAHAAYYIENNGEAAIFDPLRDVQHILIEQEKIMRKLNMYLKHIFMLILLADI